MKSFKLSRFAGVSAAEAERESASSIPSVVQRSRRIWTLWMLMAIILAGSVFVLGQNQSPAFAQGPRFDASAGGPPVRDPEAVAAVEQVLTTLGGKLAYQGLHSVSLQGQLQTEGSEVPSTFIWEDDFSGAKPEFRKELHIGNSVHIFVSGHGNPSESHDGTARPLPKHNAVVNPPLYLPGVVLAKAVQNQQYSVRLMPDDTGLIHILISLDLNPRTAFISPQHWYFDRKTQLPVRVEYRVPRTDNLERAEDFSITFSNFHTVSGIVIPFGIESHGPDGKTRTYTVTDAGTNRILNPNRFEVNGGGQ